MHEGPHARLGADLGAAVDRDAVEPNTRMATASTLKSIFPGGIKPEKYLELVSIIDTIRALHRVAIRNDHLGESPWGTIAVEGIAGAARDDARREFEEREMIARDVAAREPVRPLPPAGIRGQKKKGGNSSGSKLPLELHDPLEALPAMVEKT